MISDTCGSFARSERTGSIWEGYVTDPTTCGRGAFDGYLITEPNEINLPRAYISCRQLKGTDRSDWFIRAARSGLRLAKLIARDRRYSCCKWVLPGDVVFEMAERPHWPIFAPLGAGVACATLECHSELPANTRPDWDERFDNGFTFLLGSIYLAPWLDDATRKRHQSKLNFLEQLQRDLQYDVRRAESRRRRCFGERND